jgi:hypothetical protein
MSTSIHIIEPYKNECTIAGPGSGKRILAHAPIDVRGRTAYFARLCGDHLRTRAIDAGIIEAGLDAFDIYRGGSNHTSLQGIARENAELADASLKARIDQADGHGLQYELALHVPTLKLQLRKSTNKARSKFSIV